MNDHAAPHLFHVDALEPTVAEDGDHYGGSYKVLTVAMEPRDGRLGAALNRMGPQRVGCPFHGHALEDEVFYVLGGTGLLRYGDALLPLRAGDCVSCPAGVGTAHQIANTGDEDLVYLSIGKHDPHEVCFYPDSGKIMVRSLKTVGRLDVTSYYDGEPNYPRILSLARGTEPEPNAPPQPPPPGMPEPDADPSEFPPVVVNADAVEPVARLIGDHWGALFTPLTPYMKARGGTLGVNRVCVPPDRTAVPFHAHMREDEVFVVLSGTGVARYGDDLWPIRAGHCLTCPAGTGVAHQLANTGDEDLVYLAIGCKDPDEVCTYPDTGKVMVRSLQKFGRLTGTEYMAGEPDRPRVFDLLRD